jgi:Plasmid encoded RepA protein
MSNNPKLNKKPQRRQNSSNQLERLIAYSLAIETESAQEAGAIGYMARALVQATMPHKRTEALFFERTNGNFTLAMSANAKVGLPYGTIPRLLVAWLTGEAVRTKERTLVLGPSLTAFMRELGLTPAGGPNGPITRLKNQMQRTFCCAIACLYDSAEYQAYMSFTITDHYRLWWDRKTPEEAVTWRSEVRLGERFFEEAIQYPVPVDIRVLKALTRSPLALDIYCWLTYRLSYLKRQTSIPWEALQAQFGAGYPLTAQGKRNFKREFLQQLRKVHAIYHQANFQVTEECLILRPSKPHVPMLPHK